MQPTVLLLALCVHEPHAFKHGANTGGVARKHPVENQRPGFAAASDFVFVVE